MPHATTFAPLRGNQATESFRVYLDRLVIDDMHFNNYVDYRETWPFDEIMLYSGWLACGSRLTAPHLHECVMCQFSYTQTILRDHVVFAPPALTHRQMDDMFLWLWESSGTRGGTNYHGPERLELRGRVRQVVLQGVTSVYDACYSRRPTETSSSWDTRGGVNTVRSWWWSLA